MKPAENKNGDPVAKVAAGMSRAKTKKPDVFGPAVNGDELEQAARGIDYAITLLHRNEIPKLGIWLRFMRRALP